MKGDGERAIYARETRLTGRELEERRPLAVVFLCKFLIREQAAASLHILAKPLMESCSGVSYRLIFRSNPVTEHSKLRVGTFLIPAIGSVACCCVLLKPK